MSYFHVAFATLLGLLGFAYFAVLTFSDLLFPVAESRTRKQVGAIQAVILALFAAQLVLSDQDAPALVTAFGVLGLSFAVLASIVYAARPMLYLRPKGLKKISKYEYRLDHDGIVIRAYGLGGPTTRRKDKARFSIFNDSQHPLILESASVRAGGRIYAPQLSYKGRGAPLTVNPRASVPVKIILHFDRPIAEAYGAEAEVVFRFRSDSQSRELSISFEAERPAA